MQIISNEIKSGMTPSSKLILSTDLSDSAIGAVLQQSTKGNVTQISFFFVKLKDAEKRYRTVAREETYLLDQSA